MNWCKKIPIFWSILLMLGLVFSTEGWLLHQGRKTAHRMEAQFRQRQRKLAGFKPATLWPGGENQESAGVGCGFAAMQAGLAGCGTSARQLFEARAPLQATDMFFDLAGFVEKMRAQARQAGVAIKEDERFGFAAYASQGPAPGLIPAVFRQRQIVEYLVQALFEAHPGELLAVQRERPPGAGAGGKKAGAETAALSAAGGKGEADYLVAEPHLSAGGADLVETAMFRLMFTGQTPALRAFLNRLASFELPLIVRRVEVEPVSGPDPRQAGPGPPAPLPLVPAMFSQFAVTVEFVDLTPSGAPAATAVPPVKTAVWVPPPFQSHGEDWIYDVFTPPVIYYDPAARAFSATPSGPGPGGRLFALKLVAIKTRRYRLQLVGYVGAAGDYQGAFASESTGETMLARAGRRFPGLGITVSRFEVNQVCTPAPKSMPLLETAATAVVLDEPTGEEFTLTTREPCCVGAPGAVLAATEGREAGLARELHEGESFESNGVAYRLDKLSLHPPEAVVSMASSAGSRLLTRTLSLKTIAQDVVAAVRPAGKP